MKKTNIYTIFFLMNIFLLIAGNTLANDLTVDYPLITSVSGPESLTIKETGIWKINTYTPNGEYVYLTINWGDNTYPYTEIVPIKETFIIRHAYENPGTYNIILTASDNQGKNTETTITTKVKLPEPTINDNGYWTEWFDRDDPSATGDWEHKQNFPEVCEKPIAIECKTTDNIDYTQTGQDIICNTQEGLVCYNNLNDNNCKDYKVRFLCPINDIIPKTSEEIPCTDKDNGINEKIKGTTTGLTTWGAMQKEETLIDHCRLPNLLNEFYCNEKGYIEQRTIQCQCNNGACKQNNIQTTTCSDSDGGINYNTYGVVSFGSGTDIAGMFFDTCEGIILTEGYCGTNNNLQTTTISCKYGCNNGACIQQEYNTVAYGVIDEYIKLSTKMTAIYPNENIKIYFEGIIMPKCAAITCVPQAVFRITTNLPVDITEEDLETTEYSDDAKTIYLAEGKTYNLEAYVLKLYELTDNKAVIALHKNVNEELKCAPGCKEVPEGCLCPKIKVKKTLSGYDIEIGTKQTNAREIIITPGAGSITAVLDNDVAQELEVNSITDEGIALTLYNDKKVKVYTDKKLLKTYLSDDETTAETQMTIKGRDEGLTAETSFGSKAIKVSPSEASNAAKSTLSATYADIKLKEKDSDIIYELNGKLPIKILGIIPVEAKVTTTINAETGDVIDVDTPWYTTISRE